MSSILPGFATRDVVVLRPGSLVDHGTAVDDWTAPLSHMISDCLVQPLAGSEIVSGNRDETVEAWLLIAPVDADLLPTDRVQLDADTVAEVDEPIRRFVNGLNHIEANLKRIKG